MGSARPALECAAPMSFPHTVYPPSPSSISPARKPRFAVATQSPRQPVAEPVASPIAKSAEIHESAMANGTMRMKAVDFVALPAGKRVELKPGGYHVMLLGVVKPLGAGDSVPLTLTLEDPSGKRSTLDVEAAVRPPGR